MRANTTMIIHDMHISPMFPLLWHKKKVLTLLIWLLHKITQSLRMDQVGRDHSGSSGSISLLIPEHMAHSCVQMVLHNNSFTLLSYLGHNQMTTLVSYESKTSFKSWPNRYVVATISYHFFTIFHLFSENINGFQTSSTNHSFCWPASYTRTV